MFHSLQQFHASIMRLSCVNRASNTQCTQTKTTDKRLEAFRYWLGTVSLSILGDAAHDQSRSKSGWVTRRLPTIEIFMNKNAKIILYRCSNVPNAIDRLVSVYRIDKSMF